MYGQGMGTLKVYQQPIGGRAKPIFSNTGNMGELWRFAQAPLEATAGAAYRVSPRPDTYKHDIITCHTTTVTETA